MDKGKVSALTAWINSLKVEDDISNLIELQNGIILLKVMKMANKEGKPLPECSSAMQRFCQIEEFLEAYYMTTIVEKVNFEDIIENGTEYEIGKVIMLLMGAAIQYHNSEAFMKAAMSIPVELHYEIKDMMEPLLMKDPDSNAPVIPQYFGTVLKTRLIRSPGDDVFSTSPVVDLMSKYTEGFKTPSKHKSLARTLIDSPASQNVSYGDSPLTPIKAIVQSPQMTYKLRLREQAYQCKALEKLLSEEQNQKADLEWSLNEMKSDLEVKANRIKALEVQISKDKKVKDDELDMLASYREDYEKLQLELTRTKAKLAGWTDLKRALSQREFECNDLQKQMELMKEQVGRMDLLKRNHEQLQRQYSILEGELQRLRAEIDGRNDMVGHLNEALEQSQCNISQMREFHREELVALELKIIPEKSVESGGESLGMLVQMKVMELEKELQEVKSTWCDPKSHQMMQEKLNETSKSKQEIETKYVDAQGKILSLESHNNQLVINLDILKQETKATLQRCEKAEEGNTVLREREERLLEVKKELEENRIRLNESNATLKEQLSDMKHANSILEKKTENLNVALETEKSTAIQLAIKIENLNGDLINRKTENADLMRQVDERTDHENQLRARISELYKDICETEANHKQEIQSYQKATTNLESRLAKDQTEFELRMEETLSQWEEQSQQSREMHNRLLDDTERLHADKSRLHNDLDDAQQDLKNVREELQSTSLQFEMKEKELISQFESSQKQSEDSRLLFEHNNAEMMCKIDSLRQENEVIRNEAVKYEVAMKEIQELSNAKSHEIRANEEEWKKLENELIAKINFLKENDSKRQLEITESEQQVNIQKEILTNELESTRKALTTEVMQLNEQLAEEEKFGVELKTEIGELKDSFTSEIQELKTVIAEKESELAELWSKSEKEKEYFNGTVQKLEQRTTDNQKLCDQLEKELAEKQVTEARLVAEVKTFKDEMLRNELLIKEQVAENNDRQHELQEKSNKLELSKHHLLDASAQITNLSAVCEKITQDLSTSNTKVDELVKDIFAKDSELEMSRNESESRNIELGSVKMHLNDKIAEAKVLEGKLASLNDQLKLSECKLTDVYTQRETDLKVISDLTAAKQDFELKIVEKDSDLTRYVSECEKLRFDCDHLEESMNDKLNQISQLERQLQIKVEESDVKSLEVETLTLKYEECSAELRDKINEVDLLGSTITRQENESVHLKDMLSVSDVGYDTINVKLQEMTDSYVTCHNMLSEAVSKVELLESDVCELTSVKEQIESREIVNLQIMDDLRQSVSDLTENESLLRSQLQSALSCHESEIDKLTQSKHVDIEVILAAELAKRTDLQNELTQKIDEMQMHHTGQISDLEEGSLVAVVSIQEEYQQLKVDIQDKLRCSNLEIERCSRYGEEQIQEINTLRDKLDFTEEIAAENVAHLLDKLKQTEYEKSQEIVLLESKMSDLDLRLTERQSKIEKLEDMQQNSEEKIASLQSDHEQTLGLLQTELGSLKSHVEALQYQLSDATQVFEVVTQEKNNVVDQMKAAHEALARNEQALDSEQKKLECVTASLEAAELSHKESLEKISNFEKSLTSKNEEVVKMVYELDVARGEMELMSEKVQHVEQKQSDTEEAKIELSNKIEIMEEELRNRDGSHAQKVSKLEILIEKLTVEKDEMVTLNEHRINEFMHALKEDEDTIKYDHEIKTELRGQIHRLEVKLEDAQKQVKDEITLRTELSRQLRSTEEKRESLQGAYEQIRASDRLQRDKVIQLDRELSTIRDDLVHEQKTRNSIQSQSKRNEDRIFLLEREITDVLNSSRNFEDESNDRVESLEHKIKAYINKSKYLEKDLIEAQHTKQKVEENWSAMDRKVRDQMSKERHLFNKRIAQLENHLMESSHQCEQFKKSYEIVKKELNETQDELEKETDLKQKLVLHLEKGQFKESGDGCPSSQEDSLDDSLVMDKMLKHDTDEEDGPALTTDDLMSDIQRYSSTHTINSMQFGSSMSSINTETSRRSPVSMSSLRRESPQALPLGLLFSCDDEPQHMEFEWGRLNELQRRNTLCPPHMKSSYPVETQVINPDEMSQELMKKSTESLNKSVTKYTKSRSHSSRRMSPTSMSDHLLKTGTPCLSQSMRVPVSSHTSCHAHSWNPSKSFDSRLAGSEPRYKAVPLLSPTKEFKTPRQVRRTPRVKKVNPFKTPQTIPSADKYFTQNHWEQENIQPPQNFEQKEVRKSCAFEIVLDEPIKKKRGFGLGKKRSQDESKLMRKPLQSRNALPFNK